MNAPRTARQLARAELTRAITDAARRQLAEVGAPALSLRAVARELGMASSAVYRYFASRDELLTALILDAYNAVGDEAERADAAARSREADPDERWLAVCRATRWWALAHPHEFALIFGSPVPGYEAPTDTVAPAARIPRLLAAAIAEAAARGVLRPPTRTLGGLPLVTPETLAAIGWTPEPPYEDLVERSLVLWIALIGTIAFELFGHLHNVVSDYGAYFDAAMVAAAEVVGLDLRRDRSAPAPT